MRFLYVILSSCEEAADQQFNALAADFGLVGLSRCVHSTNCMHVGYGV